MRKFLNIISILLLIQTAGLTFAQNIPHFSDADGNIFAFQPMTSTPRPTLLFLDCNGAREEDIDTSRFIYDSLKWNIAVCGSSRNHRDPRLNETDILVLVHRLYSYSAVDRQKIVLFGFSGQGAQALGTYLRHPQYFAGVVTECAHPGLIYNPDFKDAEGKPVILITREQEWNRGWNEMMAQIFSDRGMNVKLIMTPGEHHIGDAKELYNACEIIDSLFIENTIPHF